MKLDDFKKLEETIKEQDFNKSYKNINNVTFGLSIFGHIASIFLAYFLLSKVIAGAIDNNPVLVVVSSIVLLSGLELLKREIFDKFSLQRIKTKKTFHKDVLPLAISSLLLISISFYATISGSKEFSSKSVEIEEKSDMIISNYKDSLNNILTVRLDEIDKEISDSKTKINDKDKEQTEIESQQPLNYQQRARVKDLKEEKKNLRLEVDGLEDKSKEIKTETSDKISKFESNIKEDEKDKKDENSDNSYLFVVISILIEFMILFGVYFNEYYKYRSYEEFKNKIEKDENYQRWYNYNMFIDIIFNVNTKVNDKLASMKSIQDICKVNGVILLNKDMVDLFKLFISLGIIKSSGNNKYFAKTKETTKEILKSHFKID